MPAPSGRSSICGIGRSATLTAAFPPTPTLPLRGELIDLADAGRVEIVRVYSQAAGRTSMRAYERLTSSLEARQRNLMEQFAKIEPAVGTGSLSLLFAIVDT